MRAMGHRERSVTMADPLEETISLSGMTEITETEDPRATQQTCKVTQCCAALTAVVETRHVASHAWSHEAS